MGREAERPTSWPPPSLGGRLFQRSWCSVCLSQGEPGGSSSLSLRGKGAGRALPRCLETCLARTTCAPGVPFQKRLVRPVPREPGNYGGLPGSPKPSHAPDAPSEGRPGPGPDRGSCSPRGEGASVLVWKQRRACAHPRRLPPRPDRHTEAPCSPAGPGPGRPDALCPLQAAAGR